MLRANSVMYRISPIVISVALLSWTALAQESLSIASDPHDLSRPISTLLDQLRKENVPVTYEDPRYANSADIRDITAEVARDPAAAARPGHRTLIPKGRPIRFVYAPEDVRNPHQAELVIARILREYRSLGGPTFAVTRDANRLHVVPADVLDAEGNRIKQSSILDALISIPVGPRDGLQFLQAICDELKKQIGFEIGIGPSVPSNNLEGYRTNEGIDKMSAQTAIERLLDKSSRTGNFVWDFVLRSRRQVLWSELLLRRTRQL